MLTGEHAAPSDAVDDRKSKLQLADYFCKYTKPTIFTVITLSIGTPYFITIRPKI